LAAKVIQFVAINKILLSFFTLFNTSSDNLNQISAFFLQIENKQTLSANEFLHIVILSQKQGFCARKQDLEKAIFAILPKATIWHVFRTNC